MSAAQPAASSQRIVPPNRSPGLGGLLFSGPSLPRFAATIAARLTGGTGAPWRLGSTVLVIAHAHVREALERDLDFGIAPVNAGRIADVDQAFVLGMDRHPVLARERQALYRAFSGLDLTVVRDAAQHKAAELLAGEHEIDVVGGYARPIAAGTAQALFGVTGPDDATFQDVARSIFGHTFLNIGNDPVVRECAINASRLLDDWLDAEMKRRSRSRRMGEDMMGRLLSDPDLDRDTIRRTLAGMLVGAVDTTATAVAKIVATIGSDRSLAQKMAADCDNPDRTYGWCLEALRLWPHNPILFRHAMRDTILGGAAIRTGDRLILWTQAAMMDASAFPDPGRLRWDRPFDSYLHFGGCLHSCAGRAVNRWQIPLLVSALLARGIDRVGKVGWAGPFPDKLTVRLAS